MVFGLFGGGNLDVSIELDRPDGAYAPGDTVVARIAVAATKGGKVRELRAGLVMQHKYQVIVHRRNSNGNWSNSNEWRTNEVWVTREVLAAEGAIAADFSEARAIEWAIPADAIPTCAGEIVQVTWSVKLTADRALARDQNEEVELRVVVPPTGEYAQPGEGGEMNTNSGVAMRLDVPTLELIEGGTLQGRLIVEPSQSIDAREIRVELIRDERVHVGDAVHAKQISVEKVRVAESPKLVPGTPLTLDFELPIPATGTPSHAHGDTEVTWQLVGTVDRPMRGDFTVTQWVGMYNG